MRYGRITLAILTIGIALALAGCPTMGGSMKNDSGSMGSGGSMNSDDSMKQKSGMGSGGYAFAGVAEAGIADLIAGGSVER